MDKNQNFDYLFSPAASIVWKPNKRDIIRASFSSAVRNPTLTDQYFDYNQGQATLIGNLNGFGYDEYFVNIDSLYFKRDSKEILYNINLFAQEGKILCLLGPSGSGKTTLLRLISGLEVHLSKVSF